MVIGGVTQQGEPIASDRVLGYIRMRVNVESQFTASAARKRSYQFSQNDFQDYCEYILELEITQVFTGYENIVVHTNYFIFNKHYSLSWIKDIVKMFKYHLLVRKRLAIFHWSKVSSYKKGLFILSFQCIFSFKLIGCYLCGMIKCPCYRFFWRSSPSSSAWPIRCHPPNHAGVTLVVRDTAEDLEDTELDSVDIQMDLENVEVDLAILVDSVLQDID